MFPIEGSMSGGYEPPISHTVSSGLAMSQTSSQPRYQPQLQHRQQQRDDMLRRLATRIRALLATNLVVPKIIDPNELTRQVTGVLHKKHSVQVALNLGDKELQAQVVAVYDELLVSVFTLCSRFGRFVLHCVF